jgi:hypothetical protein
LLLGKTVQHDQTLNFVYARSFTGCSRVQDDAFCKKLSFAVAQWIVATLSDVILSGLQAVKDLASSTQRPLIEDEHASQFGPNHTNESKVAV